MERYAAFLRGINLGRRRVTGEELCIPFVKLGLTGVATFLASGNVVFDVNGPVDEMELSERIEREIEGCLGFPAETFLRSSNQLGAIVGRTPFPPTEPERPEGKLQVMLLCTVPEPDVAAEVLAHATGDDRLALHGTELYWLPAGRMSDSSLDLRAVERLLGACTMRTANTLARLHAKYLDGPGAS